MPDTKPRDPAGSDPVRDAALTEVRDREASPNSPDAMRVSDGHVAITDAVYICDSATLTDGGKGVRTNVQYLGREASIFFIRFDEKVYGYLNQCAHVPMELDWNEGQFFDDSGLYLICATHGAIYTPESGRCVGGPCRGAKLRAVQVEERETPSGRAVYWLPDDAVRPVAAV
jgi:nitrite reductase/ring-hydroxylating ferredoxin subunit